MVQPQRDSAGEGPFQAGAGYRCLISFVMIGPRCQFAGEWMFHVRPERAGCAIVIWFFLVSEMYVEAMSAAAVGLENREAKGSLF